jgi:hypothetical protein
MQAASVTTRMYDQTLTSREAPAETVSHETPKHRRGRYFRNVFSILFLPKAIYRGLHALMGKIAIVPSGNLMDKNIKQIRKNALSSGSCVFKKITFVIDGNKIDATLMGERDKLTNGKWITHAIGNDRCYETEMHEGSQTSQLMNAMDANVILFNYPGIGESKGLPTRDLMVASQRAVFDYLQKEVGATEITAVGSSLGGGVQAVALDGYTFNEGVTVKSVKMQTFTKLSDKAASQSGLIGRACAKFFGWEMDVVSSSERLKIPEVILQTGMSGKLTTLDSVDNVYDDGAFTPQVSLAHGLLQNQINQNKKFVSFPRPHMAVLQNAEAKSLAQTIKDAKWTQNKA